MVARAAVRAAVARAAMRLAVVRAVVAKPHHPNIIQTSSNLNTQWRESHFNWEVPLV